MATIIPAAVGSDWGSDVAKTFLSLAELKARRKMQQEALKQDSIQHADNLNLDKRKMENDMIISKLGLSQDAAFKQADIGIKREELGLHKTGLEAELGFKTKQLQADTEYKSGMLGMERERTSATIRQGDQSNNIDLLRMGIAKEAAANEQLNFLHSQALDEAKFTHERDLAKTMHADKLAEVNFMRGNYYENIRHNREVEEMEREKDRVNRLETAKTNAAGIFMKMDSYYSDLDNYFAQTDPASPKRKQIMQGKVLNHYNYQKEMSNFGAAPQPDIMQMIDDWKNIPDAANSKALSKEDVEVMKLYQKHVSDNARNPDYDAESDPFLKGVRGVMPFKMETPARPVPADEEAPQQSGFDKIMGGIRGTANSATTKAKELSSGARGQYRSTNRKRKVVGGFAGRLLGQGE